MAGEQCDAIPWRSVVDGSSFGGLEDLVHEDGSATKDLKRIHLAALGNNSPLWDEIGVGGIVVSVTIGVSDDPKVARAILTWHHAVLLGDTHPGVSI